VVTYVLIACYAALCAKDAPGAWIGDGLRGAPTAAAWGFAAFLLLLAPGLQTPKSASKSALAALEGAGPSLGSHEDGALRRLIESLGPDMRQLVSDSLHAWKEAEPTALRPARDLLGAETAPVRITGFSDPLCSHCADLHEALAEIRRQLPPDRFALEQRHFPLDGACNPAIPQKADDPIRCIAARAQICFEGRPEAFAYSAAIYGNQRRLDEEKVYALAAPVVDRSSLRACIESSETGAKLAEDIEWARELRIRGTPLVLVNGRPGTPFPPFLLAMLLAEGDPDHPAFEALPAPQHLH
jgi:serine/threonine-protein kinase